MNFFAVFMRKLETLAKLECTLPPFLGRFCIANGRRWRFPCMSQYRALFVDITSTRRCGTPVLEKSSLLRTGREFP